MLPVPQEASRSSDLEILGGQAKSRSQLAKLLEGLLRTELIHGPRIDVGIEILLLKWPDTPTPSRDVIENAIAGKSPLAVRGSKEMLLYSRDHSVTEGLNYIATWNAGMLSQADLEAGMQAQMTKAQAHYED